MKAVERDVVFGFPVLPHPTDAVATMDAQRRRVKGDVLEGHRMCARGSRSGAQPERDRWNRRSEHHREDRQHGECLSVHVPPDAGEPTTFPASRRICCESPGCRGPGMPRRRTQRFGPPRSRRICEPASHEAVAPPSPQPASRTSVASLTPLPDSTHSLPSRRHVTTGAPCSRSSRYATPWRQVTVPPLVAGAGVPPTIAYPIRLPPEPE